MSLSYSKNSYSMSLSYSKNRMSLSYSKNRNTCLSERQLLVGESLSCFKKSSDGNNENPPIRRKEITTGKTRAWGYKILHLFMSKTIKPFPKRNITWQPKQRARKQMKEMLHPLKSSKA